jgi:hypothetical protein
MTKWLNLAWWLDLPLLNIVYSFFSGLPFLQNRVHAQMTEIEYRQWHPDLMSNKGISCYQCGGTAQVEVALNAKQCGIACARCKSILWRKAATV